MKATITNPRSISRLIVCLNTAAHCIERMQDYSEKFGVLQYPGNAVIGMFDTGTIPDEFLPFVSRLNDPEVISEARINRSRMIGFLWWKKPHYAVREKADVIAYLRTWASILSERYTSEGIVECPKCGILSCDGDCRDSIPAEEHAKVVKSELYFANHANHIARALRHHKEVLAPFTRIQIPDSEPDTKELFSGITAGHVRAASKVYKNWSANPK